MSERFDPSEEVVPLRRRLLPSSLLLESGEDDPVLVRIPKNIPSAHINLSKNASAILALADIAWRPNDNEMENTTFDDYDWKKWEPRKD